MPHRERWVYRVVGQEIVAFLVPLAFACIPVVGMLWVSGPTLAPPRESVARIGALIFAVTLVCYLPLRRGGRVIASNTLGLPLFLLGLYPTVGSATRPLEQEVLVAGAWLVLCVASGFLARWLSRIDAATVHQVLATVALVLAAFGARLAYRTYVAPTPYSPEVRLAISDLSSLPPLPTPRTWTPDVYDLVLDGMGRPDVIKEDFELDLSRELQRLHDLGFDVEERAHANYPQTQLSLSSMLNMAYLDPLIRAEGGSNDHRPLTDLISQSRVQRIFKHLGYWVEDIGTGYLSSGAFEQADLCDCPQLWFADAEVGAISLSPFKMLTRGFGSRAHYNRTIRIFEQFERRRTVAAPRFVFAHVPMPHPPFVADARGDFTNPTKLLSVNDASFYGGSRQEYEDGYKAQVIFALERAIAAVSRVLEDATHDGRDVIVIVHGDHGPRLDYDANQPTVASGRRVLPILLATHWPQGKPPRASAISLVNVYRVLFSHVFGTDLPPVKDTGYVSGFNTPYLVTEVAGARGDEEDGHTRQPRQSTPGSAAAPGR